MIPRLFTIITVFISGLFLSVSTAFAAGEFETKFHSTYEIDESANTTITHRVELKNLSPNIYASEYSVTVGSTDVRNPGAFDSNGSLKLSATASDNTTTLTVSLEQKPTIGVGKTTAFSIQYQSADTASKIGRILEVNAPKVANAIEFRDYSMTIVVPKTFGNPSRIIPEPTSLRETAISTIVSFNKESLKSGVTAVFGTKQSFRLKLTYYLENKSSLKSEKKLALVPDTWRQKLEYRSLLPRPKKIESDSDGNWLAIYELTPRQKLAVSAEAVVEVNLDPVIPAPQVNQKDYLGETEYWQIEDQAIKDLAKKLKTPREIYDFVVRTLSYDYWRAENDGGRRGAVGALNKPNESICTEFTDLFISISRAAGIPARERNGFAFTTNPKLRPVSLKKDVLHAWPEYWDNRSNQWIEVDPTWAKTTGGIDYFSKLDLWHITFVIHGKSATSPLPAGFYKIDDPQAKTVEVSPVDETVASPAEIEVAAYIPEILSNWKRNQIRFEVINKSGKASYQLPIKTESSYTITNPGVNNSQTILPWQSYSQVIWVKPTARWARTRGGLKISAGPVTKTYEVNSAPPINFNAAVAVGIAGISGVATAVAVFGRRLRVPRQPE